MCYYDKSNLNCQIIMEDHGNYYFIVHLDLNNEFKILSKI
jgi:hypothetical protein